MKRIAFLVVIIGTTFFASQSWAGKTTTLLTSKKVNMQRLLMKLKENKTFATFHLTNTTVKGQIVAMNSDMIAVEYIPKRFQKNIAYFKLHNVEAVITDAPGRKVGSTN